MNRLQLTNLALALVFLITLLPAQAQIIVQPPVQVGIHCPQLPLPNVQPPVDTSEPIRMLTAPPSLNVPVQVRGGIQQTCTDSDPMEGSCQPYCPNPAARPTPVFPDPPASINRDFQEMVTSKTNFTYDPRNDIDQDGIPDLTDAVNLPSEAKRTTNPTDYLRLTEGLPQAGFALLIEPSHNEAQLVVADPTSLLGNGTLSAQQALNLVKSLQGAAARNALATVIHSGMRLTFTVIAPEAPANVTLAWTSPRPADGSWLLINTDPTRLIDLTLAGSPIALASRAASHFSNPLDATDYRWQFLNLHDVNFCYDAATHSNGTDCQGHKWPGWIRAYSGQAAYALEAANAGLLSGAIPLTTKLPSASERLATESCADGQIGLIINGQRFCFTQPKQGSCPPDQQGIVVNDTPICVTPPTVGECPPPTVGVVLNGTRYCVAPFVPKVSPCPGPQVGVIVDDFPVCFTVGGAQPCPSPKIGIETQGTRVCIDNSPECPPLQINVTLGRQPYCISPDGGLAKAIDATGNRSCALLVSGNVECWGQNYYGESDSYLGGDARQLSAGEYHTCVLQAAASIHCWGGNDAGQVLDYPGPATAVVAAGHYTCALLPTANVDCWGTNSYNDIPDYLGGDATAISGGYFHVCALLVSSNVHCWGYNGYQATDYTGGNAKAISVGAYQSCALLVTGDVHCWGISGGSTDYTGHDAQAVSAGTEHTCILRANTTVYCWDDTFPRPNQIIGATAISAGGMHDCALLATGKVDCWGDNSEGQSADHSLLTAIQACLQAPPGTLCSPTPVPCTAPSASQEPGLASVLRQVQGSGLDSALLASGLAAQWQLHQANLTLSSSLVGPVHANLTAAARELAARHNVTLPSSAAASLANLTAPQAAVMTEVLDAFMGFEDATRAAFAHANQSQLQQLRDSHNATASAVGPGIDYALIYAARNRLALATPRLVELQHGAPGAPGLPPVSVNVCPAFDLDFTASDTTYTQDCPLIIDFGGNDAYHNNAGGSGTAPYCGALSLNQGATAAAVIDLAGNDEYSTRSCGANGGGYNGAGFLLDVAGNDIYPSAGIGSNGGANLGAGFLLDVEGDDTYQSGGSGVNGGAWAGFGFLLDRSGHDTYTATDYAGNGGGYTLGNGFLIDMAGNDAYHAGGFGVNGQGYDATGLLLDLNGIDTYTDGVGGSGTDKTVVPKTGGSLYGLGAQIDTEAPTSPSCPPNQSQTAPAPPPAPPQAVPTVASTYHQKLPLRIAPQWHVLGNRSYAFPTGIGVDYALDAVGTVSQASLVTQVADSLLNATAGPIPVDASPRVFRFMGGYYSMPAEPRNLNSIRLGIESLSDSMGQTFLVDGKRIQQLLELGPGETFQVAIDPEHEEGFQWRILDLNHDGALDLVARVPHFSAAWMTLTNNQWTGTFANVKMTSTTAGWLTGAGGAVYHYNAGNLVRYDVAGAWGSVASEQTTLGLWVVNDKNFYVTGDCKYTNEDKRPPFIAHYQSSSLAKSAFTLMQLPDLGSGCYSINSIWMSPDQSFGYAGGSKGLWLKYASGAWTKQASPVNCAIVDLAFDTAGTGYVGLGKTSPPFTGACTPDSGGAVLSWNGSSFTNAAASGIDNVQHIKDDWAVGLQPGYYTAGQEGGGPYGAGIFHNNAGTWQQVTGAPSQSFLGVARATSDSYWFAGFETPNGCCKGLLVNRIPSTGTWTTYTSLPDSLPTLTGVDLWNPFNGLAVGSYGTLLRFEDYAPPVIADTLSPLSTDTKTPVVGDGSASYSPNGGTLTHSWSWGDGTWSSGAVVSHRYNQPTAGSQYHVRHTIYDSASGQSQEHSWDVTVNSITIGLGSTSGSMMETDRVAHYYVLPSTTVDRYLKVSSLAGSGVWLSASLTAPPPLFANQAKYYERPGSWPRATSSAAGYYDAVLVGKVPAGSPLFIAVQKPMGFTLASYSFTVSTIAPPATPTTTLPSGTYRPSVEFTMTLPAGERPKQLVMNWGDGPASIWPPGCIYCYDAASRSYRVSHTYTATGPFTLTMSSQDDAGQSTSIQRFVTINTDPAGVAIAPLPAEVTAVSAVLHGRLDNMGGASSVTATYQLYNGATLVNSFSPAARTATGDLPAWTATGLLQGTTYRFQVKFTNTVGESYSAWQEFQTTPGLAILPQSSAPSTVNLGSSTSLSLRSASQWSNQVAYWVKWDTAWDAVRYPTTGYVPYNQNVPATGTYAFAGVHTIEVRLEDSLQSRSAPITLTATVTGASPVSSMWMTNTQTTATVLATVGSLAYPASTQLVFQRQDPMAKPPTWTSSGVKSASGTQSWDLGTLDTAKTFLARVQFTTATGGMGTQTWLTAVPDYLQVYTNRVPTLVPGATPASVNYLEGVRYSVTYSDPEGDAPRNATGALTNPVMILNGTTYPLIGSGTNYKAGIEYHYLLPADKVPRGQSVQPEFQVWDQYTRFATSRGAFLSQQQPYAVRLDFEGDRVGGPAGNVTFSTDPLNLWHVSDTVGKDDRIAMGYHGKVLWFAYESRSTYEDPYARVPRGSVSLLPINLALVKDPVLSFSSYYVTEDERPNYDLKLVEIKSRTPGTQTWTSTQLYQVSGLQAGFASWRSLRIDLSAYADKEVQISFRFDAGDSQYNGYAGWLIDDITVGHDHDADGLPDVLEDALVHKRVAKQIGTAIADETGHARGFVRRLDRPYAENVILTAQVHVPHPSSTTIQLGAQNDYTGQTARFTLYDPGNGLRADTCNDALKALYVGDYTPFEYAARRNLELKDGNAFLRVDLARCPLQASFLTQSDWFLDVTDTNPNPMDPARVEGLSVESVGHTNHLLGDSDADGSGDGTELYSNGHDPLGIDDDRDGLPEASDTNDEVGDWMPAGLMVLHQTGPGGPTVRVALADLPAPVMAVRMQATLANGQVQDVSPQPYSQSDWVFDLPPGYPDRMTFTWEDAIGGHGTMTVDLQLGDHGYSMQWPRLTYTNSHGTQSSEEYTLYDQLTQGDLLFWGMENADDIKTVADIGKDFYELAEGLTSAPAFGWKVLKFLADRQFRLSDQGETFSATGITKTQRTGSGPQFVYARTSLVNDAGRNLNGWQLADAMKNGTVLANDRTGSMRILRQAPDGTGTILLRLVGGLVHDAWKWNGIFTDPDFENGVQLDWFQQKESGRAYPLSGTEEGRQAYQNCRATCQWRNTERMGITFLGENAATGGAYRTDQPLRMDVEPFQALRAAYDFKRYQGDSFRFEASTDALGDMAIGHTAHYARQGRLDSANLPTVFWDNGGSVVVDCQNPTSAALLTRRCSNVQYAFNTPPATYAWNSQDGFRTHDLGWRHATTSALQFQDRIAVDVSLDERQGLSPPPGMERYEYSNQQMAQVLGAPNAGAIYAALDWSTPVLPEIGVKVREVGG